MRILDRFIALTYAKAFLGGIVVFTISFIALDFLTRVNEVGTAVSQAKEAGAASSTFEVVLRYYLAYLPYVWKGILPFVAVAAATLTLSTLLRANEIFPVLAVGVSVRRLLLPVFACALLVSAVHLAIQELLIPSMSRDFVLMKRLFSGDRASRIHDLPHLRDGKGSVVRAGAYDFAARTLHDVYILRPWGPEGFETWMAKELRGTPEGDGWTAPEAVLVQPAGTGQARSTLPAGSRIEFGVSPDEVEALIAKEGTEELSFAQISRLVRKFPDRRALQVARHRQIAVPLASFVLVLVSVPAILAAGRLRFAGSALAFLSAATFYFGDIFCTSLGDRGEIAPLFAAYLPLALFLSLGVAGLATARS
ncbi:MAG: LptF/LptG family permease [Planctomycetaceae bacterium]